MKAKAILFTFLASANVTLALVNLRDDTYERIPLNMIAIFFCAWSAADAFAKLKQVE